MNAQTPSHRLVHTFSNRICDHCGEGSSGSIDIGLETRQAGSAYHWDGMRRGGDPEHPVLLLQATLFGNGRFKATGSWQSVNPGACFTSLIPSRHAYSVEPTGGRAWTFYWMLIRHDLFIKRLSEHTSQVSNIWGGVAADQLLRRLEHLFNGICTGKIEDPWSLEEAIFGLVCAIERLLSPNQTEDPWISKVKERVASDWSCPPDVTTLAGDFGLSRSAFSHAFRKRTAKSPGTWVRQIRLAEAARRLRHEDIPIKSLAFDLGFADSAQFSKSFRGHYAVTPKVYRSWFAGSREYR